MAMTVAEIIAEARGIIQETDEANSHVTNTKLIEWINACTLQLCSTTTSLPKSMVTDKVTASTITLDSSMLRVDYVSYLDPLGTHTKLETIDFNNFVYEHPDWENQIASRPTKLVRLDDLNWMMWPTPSAEYLNLEMTIVGAKVPASVVNTTDIPPLSQTLHGVYPHYLAWKSFLVINDPARAQAEFNQYDALRKLNLKTATSVFGSRQQLRMQL